MAKLAIALIVCSVLAASYALPRSQRKVHPNRIIGGEDAVFGQFPYQVSLRVVGQHFCGGSLVDVNGTQVVVTAAHCVLGAPIQYLSVMAGEVRRTGSSLEHVSNISSITIHEDFDSWSLANDIAIIRLTTPFFTGFDGIENIPLPTPGQQTTGEVFISGWGNTATDGEVIPEILQFIQIPTINDAICQAHYPQETILDSMLCTGLIGEGGKDSCQGDSGGPVKAVNGGYLAGVVSWGYGCADPLYPGVNTEVSYFLDWLQANV